MSARNQSLDVLRGVAVTLVIGYHLDYYQFWHKAGWCGVDLFFVLSGFLISGLLFQEYKLTGGIRFGRFIVRRGFKIWPPLYAFLGIFFFIALIQRDSLFRFAYPALFVSNYLMPPAMFGHLWSLAVEEHFYLLLPPLLLLLIKVQRLHWIPVIYVAVAIMCLAFRCSQQLPQNGGFVSSHTRMDSLFCGVTLGYIYNFHPRTFTKLSTSKFVLGSAALCCCSLPLLLNVDTWVVQTLGLLLLSIGFGLILAWALNRDCPAWLRPISEIGKYSYSIYLWQMPVAFLVKGDSLLTFWVAMLLSIALGAVMSVIVEAPSLALRNRWIPQIAR